MQRPQRRAHPNRGASADAASLLGQAHYFAAVVESRKHGTPLTSAPGDGKYDQALAYQQQALELREALHDIRGISESYFQIGVVYERWEQYERSQACYTQARQIADQYGHPFDKTEPAMSRFMRCEKRTWIRRWPCARRPDSGPTCRSISS